VGFPAPVRLSASALTALGWSSWKRLFFFIDAAAGCAQECINKLRVAFFSETLFAACFANNTMQLSKHLRAIREKSIAYFNVKCKIFSLLRWITLLALARITALFRINCIRDHLIALYITT
jgi:hypothetical protein